MNTPEAIEWLGEVSPPLREPVLVAGFAGWNDGGQAASAAVRWLARNLDGERFARLDPEYFHVFTAEGSRPLIRRRPGGETVLRWPAHDFFAIRGLEGWPHDLIAFVAREPELRWRTYCEAVLTVARRAGVRQIVTLGAFLAPVPHTRPVPISGYAGNAESLARLRDIGALPTSYEGPTGIVSVLMDAAARAGFDTVSFWAAVPHYLPTTANPKAALALLQAVRKFTGLPLDLARLEDAAKFFEAQVTQAVQTKGEVGEHVRRLEEAEDEAARGRERPQGAESLPNADEVIKAFEEMLRGNQPKGDDAP